MSWQVRLSDDVVRELSRLDAPEARRITASSRKRPKTPGTFLKGSRGRTTSSSAPATIG